MNTLQFDFATDDSRYNYIAFLMADNNSLSIKVAKYSGKDRVDLIQNNEYGYCSLIKATKSVLDKLDIENTTFAKITPKERIEQNLWDKIAIREAVINAIIHNDYTNEVPSKFEIFDDRLEITSAGSLPMGLSKDEFFSGVSNPRNREIMRIYKPELCNRNSPICTNHLRIGLSLNFLNYLTGSPAKFSKTPIAKHLHIFANFYCIIRVKDLEMVEQLGSGIPRILRVYDRDSFIFMQNFTRMVFYKGGSIGGAIGGAIGGQIYLTDRQKDIIDLIQNNPKISYRKMAQILDIADSAVKKHLETLKNKGVLKRVGGTRGYWDVFL